MHFHVLLAHQATFIQLQNKLVILEQINQKQLTISNKYKKEILSVEMTNIKI